MNPDLKSVKTTQGDINNISYAFSLAIARESKNDQAIIELINLKAKIFSKLTEFDKSLDSVNPLPPSE